MSRNSEIKNKQLLEGKPYITKKELSFLLEKKGKNLDKKVTQLLKTEYLLYLKKGLYTTESFYLLNKAQFPEFLSNFLYYPSYLSLEYVLQLENLIPEAVYQYTSISLKPTRTFKNGIGVFSYRNIKKPLFMGFIYKPFFQELRIKIATKAKALFDLLYLKPLSTSRTKDVITDLRINWDNFKGTDLQQFEEYTLLSKSKKMSEVLTVIKNNFYVAK